MMSHKKGYVYPALRKETEIRIVVLAPGAEDEPIHCFLMTIDLNEDWELQDNTTRPKHYPAQKWKFAADMDGQGRRSFTMPTLQLDSTSTRGKKLHAFQRYVALSYVWGDQADLHKIFLNEEPFYVGHSLYSALKRFRGGFEINTMYGDLEKMTMEDKHDLEAKKHHLESEGRLLWVDAICINQDDVAEREAQVKLMSRIYRQADYVYADIGQAGNPVGEQLSDLFQIVIDAGTRYREHGLPSTCFSNANYLTESEQIVSRWFRSAPTGLEDQGIPSEDDPLWQSWQTFLASPYFRRLWIVQEFCLPKRITLWFGDIGFDPVVISKFMGSLLACSSNQSFFVPAGSMDVAAGLSAFEELTFQRAMIHPPMPLALDSMSLLYKLSLIRSTLVTDQRDKLYGALGLASDGHEFFHLISYSKSVEAVYEDFAMHFINKGQGIDLLYQVDSRVSKTLQIPSWVPVGYSELVELADLA
jgi:hypothetical protein